MMNYLEEIESHLINCWSIKTCSKWTAENPHKGQCSVTSLVINDLFGGQILKTSVDNQWHYYNRIDKVRYDFTSKQFDFELNYEDVESSREEAFSDTNEFQYNHLKGAMEKELFGITDINFTEHYNWGNCCDGWHLVKTDSLSVIREKMPTKSKEQTHYHKKSQQFFYILSGVATFEIEGQLHRIEQNKGIHIKPGVVHRISNNEESDLEFIVVSEPKSHGDRVNIDENK